MNQLLSDWQTIIAAIQHWLAGGDPYGMYLRLDGTPANPGAFAYPPPALLLGTPFALLPLYLSGVIMLLISIVGFEHWVRRATERIGLLWLLLWLPLAQGIVLGQTTLLFLVGLMLAEQCARDKRDTTAGLLLALVLLKPQSVLLPAAWLLFHMVRERRWHVLGVFGSVSLALWGGALLIGGIDIYRAWLAGMQHYSGTDLPSRALISTPLGPALGLLALLFWWRHGRGDMLGMLLLLNTLLVPLRPVPYAAVALAFVAIRWRHDWVWYPLLLSWVIPVVFTLQRTPETLTGLTQAIVATGLLAGLLPTLLRNRFLPRSSTTKAS